MHLHLPNILFSLKLQSLFHIEAIFYVCENKFVYENPMQKPNFLVKTHFGVIGANLLLTA